MRIIAGAAKGKSIRTPKSGTRDIRPTLSRIRGTIFDLIGPIHGLTVCDLYAGCGSLGLEALSRGAEHVTFVDFNRVALNLVRDNLDNLGFTEQATIIKASLPKQLRCDHLSFDLVFCDPPYEEVDPEPLFKVVASIIKPNGLAVFQAGKRLSLAERYGTLAVSKHRKYGDTNLFLYQHENKDNQEES